METASSTASPRQSSPMPGPLMRVPSTFTLTSVPSGNTVSRWPESTTTGPVSRPGRVAITLPSASMRTSRSPSARKRRCSSSARRCSLNGGAGISQMVRCCSSVHALSARMRSSAARTGAASAALAPRRWAQAGAAATARSSAAAVAVRVVE